MATEPFNPEVTLPAHLAKKLMKSMSLELTVSSRLNNLQFLCKADNLSFILMYDNHKRFNQSPREYLENMYDNATTDSVLQDQIADCERRNSIITLAVYDQQMTCKFEVMDVNLERCISGAIEGIQSGLQMKLGDKFIDSAK